MSRSLTAQDRSSLIRLASSLPAGSAERKAILAKLKGEASRTASSSNALTLYATKLAGDVAKRYGGHLPEPLALRQDHGGGVEVSIIMMTPVLRNIFNTSETGDLDEEGEAEAASIAKGLAKAFGVSASSVDWEAQDSAGYIFSMSVGS